MKNSSLASQTRPESAVVSHAMCLSAVLDLQVNPSLRVGGRGMTPFTVPSFKYNTPVPSFRPTAIALPLVLQDATITPSSLTVCIAPLTTSIRTNFPLSKTAAKTCSISGVGLGRSARIGCLSVLISLPGLKFCFIISLGSNTARPPPSSAEMTRKSPSEEKATWRSAGTGMEASGAKSEMTSHSPGFCWNALRTFAVDARTSVSGPAAASRPGFEAIAKRVALAGGTLSVDHGVGRILSLVGPSAPWLRPLKAKSWAAVSSVCGRARVYGGAHYLCENANNICAHVGRGRRGALALAEAAEAHAAARGLWADVARVLSAEETGRGVMRAAASKYGRRLCGMRARGRLLGNGARAQRVERLLGGRVGGQRGLGEADGSKARGSRRLAL
jgi:hypothetical protein